MTAAIQLGVVPLLLRSWGPAKYGDWLILFAIPGYLTLSDLGFGDASGSDMTARVAAGDRQGALRTFQSSWMLLNVVSAAILATAAAVVWGMPWKSLLHLSTVGNRDAGSVIWYLAIYVVLSQQNGVFESGFRCQGLFAFGTALVMILRLAESVVALAVGVWTGNLILVAISYATVRACGTIGYALALTKLVPWISLGTTQATIGAIKSLTLPALGFIAFPTAYALGFQGATVLVGALLGPVAVTMFSTLRTLTRVGSQITIALAHSLWPELSRAFGGGQMTLVRDLHRAAFQVTVVSSVIVTTTLSFLGPSIYFEWLHRSVQFDGRCFNILLIAAAAAALWTTSSTVTTSANVHHRPAFFYLLTTAASLVLAGLVLIPRMALSGMAAALLGNELIMLCLVVKVSVDHSGDSYPNFIRSIPSLAWVRSMPYRASASGIRVPTDNVPLLMEGSEQ